MIGYRIGEAKKFFFDRPLVLRAVGRARRKNLSRFGAFVMTRARTSMRRRKRPSEPGRPPSVHVGLVRSRTFFAYDTRAESTVIGPEKVGGKIGNAPEALEKGGPSLVFEAARRGREKQQRRVTIRPRPFMQPAFNEELKRQPADWKDTIRP